MDKGNGFHIRQGRARGYQACYIVSMIKGKKWVQTIQLDGLYEINNDGEIRNTKNILIKNKDINNSGYVRIVVRIKQKQRRAFLHRLLAEAFLSNPKNLKQVNHIDGIKTNNSIENLEWVSAGENIKHAIKNKLLIPNVKQMLAYNKKHGVWNKGLHTGNQYSNNLKHGK